LNWILHAPDGYGIEVLPEPMTRAFGPARIHMTWERGGNGTVVARFHFECDRQRWTPAEVDEARAALKVFGEEPSPVIVFQNRGEAHLEAGRLKEAMAEFQAQAGHQPGSPAPLVRLALVQRAAGLEETSRKTLLKAVSLDPSAEQPHRQLGWSFQHDTLGRRFGRGWDRTAAAAELRKAMELAPELRMARLDLAILLGHDEQGDWWASKDMNEVIRLYRDQLARGKDESAQSQLTTALARTGSLGEARSSAQLLEDARERQGWTIALDACLKGADAAIQDARRSIQDPGIRRKALQEASDLLMSLRRYPEAGAVAGECLVGDDAAKYQSRAKLAPRMKRHEELPLDLKTPVGAVLALARATAQPGFDREAALAFLSPAQRPVVRDEATLQKLLEGLHHFRTSSRDWRLQKLDEIHAMVDYGIEGGERTGFRIRVPRPSPLPGTLFVSSQNGVFRVVSWGVNPMRLGKEALWEADRGNLEAARAWLDRAMDQVVMPNTQDPLSGHSVGRFWSKGRAGTLEEIRLAAAVLILDREEQGAARKIAEGALTTATDPIVRGALLRVLSLRRIPDRKAADRYTAELQSQFFDKSSGGAFFRASVLAEDKRFDEALALLREARKRYPAHDPLLLMEANALSQLGRLGEARELLRQAVQTGNDSVLILNNLAWYDLCLGQVTSQSAEWAERAVQLAKNSSNLHTLACIEAELGRYAQAKTALLESVPEEDPMGAAAWFALGLIAQSLDDEASARACFQRVDAPENPEDPANPMTCKAMARKRLAAMEKGRT
jgi:tetratricopeptide (TPR) repeat protein